MLINLALLGYPDNVPGLKHSDRSKTNTFRSFIFQKYSRLQRGYYEAVDETLMFSLYLITVRSRNACSQYDFRVGCFGNSVLRCPEVEEVVIELREVSCR
ncbi:hypothetical protein RRG08_043689 [Elysia crispata]|uniref:Uncharacterized protein n=1 Tax=Elysia crispata TaxID=231223 RepID=A0AAE0ZN23_9GAST|nr:hypothetical protein RRG08_043689 [Elysia crispata]